MLEALLRASPTGWSVVALVAAWGVWVIADSIKKRPTEINIFVHESKGEAE